MKNYVGWWSLKTGSRILFTHPFVNCSCFAIQIILTAAVRTSISPKVYKASAPCKSLIALDLLSSFYACVNECTLLKACTALGLADEQLPLGSVVCSVFNITYIVMPNRHSFIRFHSQEWPISSFVCSLTTYITSHSMKNLAFRSLLRRKMIILPILTTSLIHFWKGWGQRMYFLNLGVKGG